MTSLFLRLQPLSLASSCVMSHGPQGTHDVPLPASADNLCLYWMTPLVWVSGSRCGMATDSEVRWLGTDVFNGSQYRRDSAATHALSSLPWRLVLMDILYSAWQSLINRKHCVWPVIVGSVTFHGTSSHVQHLSNCMKSFQSYNLLMSLAKHLPNQKTKCKSNNVICQRFTQPLFKCSTIRCRTIRRWSYSNLIMLFLIIISLRSENNSILRQVSIRQHS